MWKIHREGHPNGVFFPHLCLFTGGYRIPGVSFFLVGWMELDCFFVGGLFEKTVMVVFHFQTVA
jgi:hypothetical protein